MKADCAVLRRLRGDGGALGMYTYCIWYRGDLVDCGLGADRDEVIDRIICSLGNTDRRNT